jgi:hypothetical protein
MSSLAGGADGLVRDVDHQARAATQTIAYRLLPVALSICSSKALLAEEFHQPPIILAWCGGCSLLAMLSLFELLLVTAGGGEWQVGDAGSGGSPGSERDGRERGEVLSLCTVAAQKD